MGRNPVSALAAARAGYHRPPLPRSAASRRSRADGREPPTSTSIDGMARGIFILGTLTASSA